MSPFRRAGLLTLRGYLIIAALTIVFKVVQTATGTGAPRMPSRRRPTVAVAVRPSRLMAG